MVGLLEVVEYVRFVFLGTFDFVFQLMDARADFREFFFGRRIFRRLCRREQKASRGGAKYGLKRAAAHVLGGEIDERPPHHFLRLGQPHDFEQGRRDIFQRAGVGQ